MKAGNRQFQSVRMGSGMQSNLQSSGDALNYADTARCCDAHWGHVSDMESAMPVQTDYCTHMPMMRDPYDDISLSTPVHYLDYPMYDGSLQNEQPPIYTCTESSRRKGIAKKKSKRDGSTRLKPLARSQLRPIQDVEAGTGARRRGRPAGSGNRRQMVPRVAGPDGVKKFNMRSATYTGVYRARGGRWRAQISHQGKVVQLGMYDDEQVAAHRWDLEAIRIRGASTRLNFPQLEWHYCVLVTEAVQSSENCEIDLSAVFNEDVIERQIQEWVNSGLIHAGPSLPEQDVPEQDVPGMLGWPVSMGMTESAVHVAAIDLCGTPIVDIPVTSTRQHYNCLTAIPRVMAVASEEHSWPAQVEWVFDNDAGHLNGDTPHRSVSMRYQNMMASNEDLRLPVAHELVDGGSMMASTDQLLQFFQDDLDVSSK